MIEQRNVEQFKELGFTLVENVIPGDELGRLRAELVALWKRAKKGLIPEVRVYEDYPRILGGLNIAGIENPFSQSPLLTGWLANSPIDDFLQALTGWPGAQLELARIHTNDRFKYQGSWHRDATVDRTESSVVAIAYFKDETGFRIADAMSQYSDSSVSAGDELQQQHFSGPLPGEHIITAPAGSIFFMKSYLLHRGYNNRSRIHLHMRFVPDQSYKKVAWSKHREKVPPFDLAQSSITKRAKLLARYLLPGQNRSSLFQR